MNILFKDAPFPHIFLENVFDKNNYEIVKNEILSLDNQLKFPKFTNSASLNENKFLKKNKGIFLIDCKDYERFKMPNYIDIIIKKLLNEIHSKNKYNLIFNNLLWGSELISKYENGDFYLPHRDASVFTMVIWLWENHITSYIKNESYLHFPEYNYHQYCYDNCGIIFPSHELHEVTKIKTKNNNRYSITIFSIYENN